MRAKLRMVKEEMWRRMHHPVPAQGKWLRHVVRGYFNYHAVLTNGQALVAFRTVTKRWYRVLTRRSERTKLNLTQMKRLIDEWLPKPRILHAWTDKRFAVSHLRWEPYAGKLHVRCGGREVTRVPTATCLLRCMSPQLVPNTDAWPVPQHIMWISNSLEKCGALWLGTTCSTTKTRASPVAALRMFDRILMHSPSFQS
jgi:hypothetical protein